MQVTRLYSLFLAASTILVTACGVDKTANTFVGKGKVTASGDPADQRRTFSLDLETPSELGWSTSSTPSAEPGEAPIEYPNENPSQPVEQGPNIQIECLDAYGKRGEKPDASPEPRYRFLSIALEADAGFGQSSVFPYDCLGAARLHISGLEQRFHYRIGLILEGEVRFSGESDWFAVDRDINVPVYMKRVKDPANKVTVDMIFEDEPVNGPSTLTCVFEKRSLNNACEIRPVDKPWVAPRICNRNATGDSCQVEVLESGLYEIVDICNGEVTTLKMAAGGFAYEVLLRGCAK